MKSFGKVEEPLRMENLGEAHIFQEPSLFWCDWCADVTVMVEGFGEVTVDISYGGAFYALVDAQRFGLDVTRSRTRDLKAAATAVTAAVKSQVEIRVIFL